jgi:hypothetical protein
VLFPFAREAAGASITRHSLRPLSWAASSRQGSGVLRREKKVVPGEKYVIARSASDEAIQYRKCTSVRAAPLRGARHRAARFAYPLARSANIAAPTSRKVARTSPATDWYFNR